MKYIYSTSQISKLSLTLCTLNITGSAAGLFLIKRELRVKRTGFLILVMLY